jgi:hypothetical protein
VDLRLVGVDPVRDRPGRGAIEALGAELDQRRLEQPLTDVVAGTAGPGRAFLGLRHEPRVPIIDR